MKPIRGQGSTVRPAYPRLPFGASGTACASFIPRQRALKRRLWIGLLAVLVLMLQGCNNAALYQDDIYNPPVYWGRHVVQQGETLYGIAWQYGRDYRELGRANGLRPPWTIKPGQVLRLDVRGTVTSSGQTASSSRPSRAPATQARTTRQTESRPVVTRPADPRQTLEKRTQTVAAINWRWPHTGTILAEYSTSGKVNKGIDIAGQPGDPVRAAAGGNVVYAGNGLLGYGNLIIVNHSEQYLSAYAHNRKILVQEGEEVKAGQVIAELGSSGANRPMLHFEIRKNGNPVNPIGYLPPR